MVFNSSEWTNNYKLTIDSSKVDEDLTDFPVSIVLSSGTGQTGFDVSNIFDELTVVSGQDGYVDDETKLLLHCIGDLSDSKHDIVSVGNPVIESCTISGIENGCLSLDGVADHLRIDSSTDWAFGTGDFTIDFWVNPSAASVASVIDSVLQATQTTYGGFDISIKYGYISLGTSNGAVSPWHSYLSTAHQLVAATWQHVAVTRTGTDLKIFVNGEIALSGTNSDNITAKPIDVGHWVGGGRDFEGSFSNIRITKGLARWTTTFTPSIVVEKDSYTKLLLDFEGDSSNSEHPIIFIGGTKIDSDFGKFDTSYYFDGASDYLTIPDNTDWYFGSDDFTIDGWFNFSSLVGIYQFFTTQWGGAGYYGHHFFYYDAGNTLRFSFGKGSTFDSYSPTVTWVPVFGTWYHIAVVRDGSSLLFFINGTQLGSTIDITGEYFTDVAADLWIGAYAANGVTPNADAYFNGYMSEIRISKGVARWSSNFIPPNGKYGSDWFNRKKIAVTTTISGVETELYTEIANWDSTNETAYLWTKVHTVLSGIDTELLLYYNTTQSGNTAYIGDTGDTPAQSVWDSNFKGVWHMEQDPSAGDILDSTSSVHHGDPQSGLTSENLVDGKIGKCINFDGTTSDRIDLPTSSDFFFDTSDFTIESICSPNSGGGPIFCNYVSINKLHVPYFDSAVSSRILVNGSDSVTGIVTTASVFQQFVAVRLGSGLKVYVDNIQSGSTGDVDGVSIGASSSNYIGASTAHSYNGRIDELRVSNLARPASWVKATYYSNWDDLITFSIFTAEFLFFNVLPEDLSTVYGVSKNLKINVTVTGTDSYGSYDASFYNSLDDSLISSTVSGVVNSEQVSVYMETPSGIDYGWYVKATSSGEEGVSSTYTFNNRFLCSGWAEDQGVRASGIPIRLYRRSTGELAGSATTTGTDGSFNIDSTFNEHHYSVALHESDDTNALIYDWIIPE